MPPNLSTRTQLHEALRLYITLSLTFAALWPIGCWLRDFGGLYDCRNRFVRDRQRPH